MAKLDLKLVRNRESFVAKKKHSGTKSNYNVAINNFENFCMVKYGKVDIFEELKENTDTEILDFIQSWIDFNDRLNPATVINLFSRVKKYLHHRGIKLHPQDIKEELEFKRVISEEMYPLTRENIQTIVKEMRYPNKVQFICQSSSLMRIGELVELKKKHLIDTNDNIIVKIPAVIAKFSKGRTTFFSKEASKMLRPLLKEMADDDLAFGSNDNVKHAETNSEQILRRILDKVKLDERYDSNGRHKINTHSFRAFGITALSRHDPNLAKKIAGQKIYLGEYDRMDDDEKLKIYQKYEYDLIIDDSEKQKAEIKKLQSEKSELEKITQDNQKLEDKVARQDQVLERLIKRLDDAEAK